MLADTMTFEFLRTDSMTADGLTKPLERIKFKRFLDMMGMMKELKHAESRDQH